MASQLDELRAQAKSFPECPGVYFWCDDRGRILYVGKAVNLRSRVNSYFSASRTNRRTRRLVSKARVVRYEVTATELQALLRESALIKREQPPYNILLRRSRSHYYLKLDASLRDSYLESTREVPDGKSLYFGPFRSATVTRDTIDFLQHVLPLRKCRAMKPKCAPCLYHQIGTCAAPMLSLNHRTQHQEAIEKLFDLLDGREDRVSAWLEEKRDRLSDALLFEHASDVQKRLEALKELMRRQTILEAAVHSRQVLIRQRRKRTTEDEILLMAHGVVVSILRTADLDKERTARWIRAHLPLMQRLPIEQSELDIAAVLERWLTVNRSHVKWVTIPQGASEEDLQERVGYVLSNQPSCDDDVPVINA